MKLVPEWITVEAESAEKAEEIAINMQHVVAIRKTLPCIECKNDGKKVYGS